MKKFLSIFLCLCVCASLLSFFSACSKSDGEQKIRIEDVPWEVKNGINLFDERAIVVEFTNNSKYKIIELSLDFSLKLNTKKSALDSFYSYLGERYELSYSKKKDLKKNDLTMFARTCFTEDNPLKKDERCEGDLIYTSLGSVYKMTYYDLFQPDLYKIVYIDKSGKVCTTYYDYINETYFYK